MIGRAAMRAPWIFNQTKEYLASEKILAAPSLSEKWNLVLRHCQLAVREFRAEEAAIRSMRAHLMAYSWTMPNGKQLRESFAHVATLAEVKAIAEENILNQESKNTEHEKVENAIPALLLS
jgi:tRNA-dihydrouridine synthase B